MPALRPRSPPRDFGVALSNGVRKSGVAVDRAFTPERGHHGKAGTPTGHIHNLPVVDTEAGFAERGVELLCDFCPKKRMAPGL
jgi:hypothetical protein